MHRLRFLSFVLLVSAVLSSAGTLMVTRKVSAESASIHSTVLDTTSNPVPIFNFCVTWLKSGASMSFGYRMTDASGNTPSNGYQGGSDTASSVTWCNGGSVLSWNTSYTVKAWASLNGSGGENPVLATYSFNTGSAPATTTTSSSTTSSSTTSSSTTSSSTTISSSSTVTTLATTQTKAWTTAPEPNHNLNAIWALVYQTPEESSYGMVTSFVCGPKSRYGLSGTTGGVNIGGGGRLGVRYIYFASSCYDSSGNAISTQCSATCFNTSTYVFSIGNGYSRYAGELIAPSTTTTTTSSTTTTTTTTTIAPPVTVPKVGSGSGGSAVTTATRPSEPSKPQIALLTSNAVRVSWGDSASNESGYIIQRSDSPVGTGVSTAMWPYKTAANVTSYDFSGLTAGSQVCFAVASFNRAGASKFSEWGCLNLANPGGAVAPPPDATLTCDAVVVKNLSTGTSFRVSVGVSNAGRLLAFEYYEKGKWTLLGQARVDASGVAMLSLKSVPISKVGSYPIRATQGSRFICEGDLTVSRKLKAYPKN